MERPRSQDFDQRQKRRNVDGRLRLLISKNPDSCLSQRAENSQGPIGDL